MVIIDTAGDGRGVDDWACWLARLSLDLASSLSRYKFISLSISLDLASWTPLRLLQLHVYTHVCIYAYIYIHVLLRNSSKGGDKIDLVWIRIASKHYRCFHSVDVRRTFSIVRRGTHGSILGILSIYGNN